MVFNGANVSENRSVGNGTRCVSSGYRQRHMDLNGVRTVDFNPWRATIVVNDLTGTNVTQVNVDLPASGRQHRRRPALMRSRSTALPRADTFNRLRRRRGHRRDGLRPRCGPGAEPQTTGCDQRSTGDVANVNGSAAADTMTVTPSPIARARAGEHRGVSTSVDVIGVASLSSTPGRPDTISGANGLAVLNIPLTSTAARAMTRSTARRGRRAPGW